jgi:hypothetical protein
MASARNKVIRGDYEGQSVSTFMGVRIGNDITIHKSNVESYELITEEKMKSASSSVLRAGAGAFLLGPIGLFAGLSGKNKGIYMIAIYFKDGKKSLIEVDDKVYKAIVSSMF